MAEAADISVLVVDDYKTMQKIISNLLKQLGFRQIDTADDGQEAIRKARAGSYGLIISDWNMEPMTGIEFLRHVRADAKIGKTPFIMVTAESKAENVITAKQAGVDNYIIKPFNAATLKDKITSVIGAF